MSYTNPERCKLAPEILVAVKALHVQVDATGDEECWLIHSHAKRILNLCTTIVNELEMTRFYVRGAIEGIEFTLAAVKGNDPKADIIGRLDHLHEYLGKVLDLTDHASNKDNNHRKSAENVFREELGKALTINEIVDAIKADERIRPYLPSVHHTISQFDAGIRTAVTMLAHQNKLKGIVI